MCVSFYLLSSYYRFVEFEAADDCAAALDNMNESEIYGRTIRCNIAKPMKMSERYLRGFRGNFWQFYEICKILAPRAVVFLHAKNIEGICHVTLKWRACTISSCHVFYVKAARQG